MKKRHLSFSTMTKIMTILRDHGPLGHASLYHKICESSDVLYANLERLETEGHIRETRQGWELTETEDPSFYLQDQILTLLRGSPATTLAIAERLDLDAMVTFGYLGYLERKGQIRKVQKTWVRIKLRPDPDESEPIGF